MARIRVVSIDAAFSNMGFAYARIDIDSLEIEVQGLRLVSTEAQDRKEVRKSSDDLRRGKELHTALVEACRGASFAIAEVPTGSQSANACWSLGIAVGVLAGCPIPLIQVSPIEVKLASVGKKTATKPEMIAWAISKYPDAPWKMVKRKGAMVPTNDNEHLADAVAGLHAAVKSQQFLQAVTMLKGMVDSPKRRAVLK